jgi:hypothetical protein
MSKRELMLNKIFPSPNGGDAEWLAKLPVFVIDNVSEYLFRGTDQEFWDMMDFPNVAPPFDQFWMEYKTPASATSSLAGRVELPVVDVGILFAAVDAEDPSPLISSFPEPFLASCREQAGEPVRWLVNATMFIPACPFLMNQSSPVVCSNFLGIGKDGRVAKRSDAPTDPSAPGRGLFSIAPVEKELLANPGLFNTFLHIGLLAISFLHCRNVTVETHNPLPRKVRNRAEISFFHGEPVIRHKTLHIHAMRRILDSEGNIGAKGLMHALHICRGHFKTFDADAPLFGKHSGTYWWNAQVRGSPAQGEVRKQYDVHPPEEA